MIYRVLECRPDNTYRVMAYVTSAPDAFAVARQTMRESLAVGIKHVWYQIVATPVGVSP